MDMRILFVGLLYTKEYEKELIRICKGNVSAAHYKFQTNVMEGLKSNGIKVTAAVSVPAGNFPGKCSKLLFRTRRVYRDYLEMGYVNIPFIKHLCRKRNLYKAADAWMRSGRNRNDNVIILYDAYLPYTKEVLKIKQKYPQLKIVIIIPDLPGELSIENNAYGILVSRILKRRAEVFYGCVHKFDGYILLTKQMAKAIGIKNDNFMVLEGIAEKAEDDGFFEVRSGKREKVFLYAGELSKKVNIDLLLDAFSRCSRKLKIRLILCGSGDMNSHIKEESRKNPKIQFLGRVDQDQLKEIEKRVDFYINPRQNSHAYTKYSFPSKNLEYLRSGKPVIAYKLDGIPQDYDRYFIYPKDNSVSCLCEVMERVCHMSDTELLQLRRKQVDFIDHKKCKEIQAKRVIDYIEALSVDES